MKEASPVDYFPRQRLSTGLKTKEWFKKCIDAGISSTIYSTLSDSKRSRKQERILQNLSEGVLDVGDIEQTISEARIHNESLYKNLQNYPLAKPRIDLLIGESIRRRFDWLVRVVNDDSISEKEKTMKEAVIKRLVDLATARDYDEEKLKTRLNDMNRWARYEYQDIRERMASQILNHLYIEQRLDVKFMIGMDSALNVGKEVYCADIINGEPILRVVGPLDVHTIRSGSSIYIEDSDIIVEDKYRPLGYIIDTYSEWLKPSEIDALEGGTINDRSSGAGMIGTNNTYPTFPADMFADPNDATDVIDFFSTVPSDADFGAFDPYGNIRESRVVWKGMRKVGVLKFYSEDGTPDERIVDENYKASKDLGEKIKWIWITEWYEGTRLGDNIYVKMQPRPIQFKSMNKLGSGGSGYTGTVYPQSMLEIMKPYQYLYIIIMEEMKKALKKFKGPRMELDLAKIPDDWKLDDWMYYAEEMGYLIVDSFREGNKGSSQGKLAGNFNTTGREYNSDMGSYVNQLILMLGFIERQVSIISGVSDQRLGQIENRETVGGIERSVTQSSHITEKVFTLHDYSKIRAMELLLETAKFAWRNNKSKKAQFVLDDLSTELLNIDGETFNESEYGLFISNSTSDTELVSSMKQLAHAMAQNDKMNMRDLMTVLTAPSVSSMRRELERSDEERRQAEQQTAEQQQAAISEQIQATAQLEQSKLEVEAANNIRDNETKIIIASNSSDGETEDNDEIEQARLRLEEERLALQKDQQDNNFNLQKEKNREQIRHNKAAETISRQKKTVS